MPEEKDTSSVRALIPSVTKLATHLGITPNAIYRWIKVDRIPPEYIYAVSRFYDVDMPFHLGASDKKNVAAPRVKPRDTLPVCMEVQRGTLTEDEAAAKLGIHVQAVTLILKYWGEQLELLYKTLCEVDDKTISLDQAALILGVTKFTVHALRNKYGFKPTPKVKVEKVQPKKALRPKIRQMALSAIAGRSKLKDTEDVVWRTVHRKITELSPEYPLTKLSHWPKSFREAYAEEIDKELPKTMVKLVKYAETSQIPLKKSLKYPKIPSNWRTADVKRMMVHILLGEETVDSIAASRSADPAILEQLFTSDLRPVDLTWDEARRLPVSGQLALAEFLINMDDASKTPRMKVLEKIHGE